MDGFPDYESIDYHLIYGALIQAARHRGTVTYQELALVVGLPVSGSHLGNRMGYLLGAVSANEIDQGRPMLSAVAVNVDGYASDGFFVLARQRGLLNSEHRDDEKRFLKDQQQQCYEIWKQKFYKPKVASKS